MNTETKQRSYLQIDTTSGIFFNWTKTTCTYKENKNLDQIIGQ